MEDPTKIIVDGIRVLMARLAKVVNRVARGKIKPAHVTTLSLIGHIPASWALFACRPILAAVLIAGFGILDSFDGALAREQKTESKLGMFYDATTDRMKEILIYSGLAVFVSKHYSVGNQWLVVAVVGTSILVSYIKAKGEMAISDKSHDKQALNRAFGNGIARYEIRMVLLIIGLLTGILIPILRLILALNILTSVTRYLEISNLLSKEDKATMTKKTEQKK